ALFEIGRVFPADREERRLAIALTGRRHPSFWTGEDRDSKFDIYDLKGMIEEFLEHFGVRGITYNRRNDSTGLLIESATVHLGKFTLGEFGQALPPLARRYDLRDPVLVGELNLDTLIARRNTSKSLKALPQFPAIRRDVAMIVPEALTHDAIFTA